MSTPKFEETTPRYDFLCIACGLVFKKNIPFGGGHLLTACCPVCQKHARRIYRALQEVFEGNGWYSTDHRSYRHNYEAWALAVYQ